MGIAVLWGNQEHTLVHVLFQGEWDWVTFYARCGEIAHLFNTAPYPVDVIMDLRDSAILPADLPTHIMRASFTRRNLGRVVIVQPDPLLKKLANFAHPQGHTPNADAQENPILYAPNLDAAYKLIEKERAAAARKPSRARQLLPFLDR